MVQHTTHKDIVLRLKRARGHLDKVIDMIENNESCIKVAQQMHAVSNAVKNSKTAFIQDHIEHCLQAGALKEAEDLQQQIDEFKEITKYL